MAASSIPGSSPARLVAPPTSLTTAQACITPPSQRRREARLLRCQYVRQRAAADAAADRDATEANNEPPTAYAPEAVAQRRAEREVPWAGWEAEAEAYAGEHFAGQLDTITFAAGQVETVDEFDDVEEEIDDEDEAECDATADFAWEAAAPELARDGQLALGFDLGGANYESYLGLDAPSNPGPRPLSRSMPEGPTLGLLLCAVYVLWRAVAAGGGPSRPRSGTIRGKTALELSRRST